MIEKFKPKINDEVRFSFKHGDLVIRSVVKSIDGDIIVLKLDSSIGSDIKPKNNVIIYSDNIDFYIDLISINGDTITISSSRAGEREFFRIDDVIPMVILRLDKNAARRSKILTGYHSDMPTTIKDDTAGSMDENLHPLLIKKLFEIDAKVSLVLERLYLESEGLFKADNYHVSISGSGVSFISSVRYEAGTVIGLKLLLSTYPTVAVHTYGEVLSVSVYNEGQYRMGCRFVDIDEDVRSEIIQFTMRREREKRMVV
ncbi:MAG: PilZ domain-containing protein [Nitrospirae bacterium]|nr:PilZ domain-containing protein [Nitrospirota bacterium]